VSEIDDNTRAVLMLVVSSATTVIVAWLKTRRKPKSDDGDE